jgi:hypothetical protein
MTIETMKIICILKVATLEIQEIRGHSLSFCCFVTNVVLSNIAFTASPTHEGTEFLAYSGIYRF